MEHSVNMPTVGYFMTLTLRFVKMAVLQALSKVKLDGLLTVYL